MKKLFIFTWLPTLLFISAVIGFTACGSDDDDDPTTPPATEQGPTEGGNNDDKTPEEPTTTAGTAVDLGLSVKWADWNIGASSPEGYGDYYAWGETSTKNDYSWSTYKYCNGSYITMTKYCTQSSYGTVDNRTTLQPTDDVARVKWGGSWRMPTSEEIEELNDKCNWQWTTYKGVNGYKVTGPNGNSIFLPAAGFRDGTEVIYQGSLGTYWSSSLYSFYSFDAFSLYFSSSYYEWYGSNRCLGQSVRPVCD